MTDPIRFRLEAWKRKLIDLTKRNRLLNFKPTRVTTIRIIDELPTEVFRTLWLQNQTMTFQPNSAPAGRNATAFDPAADLLELEESEESAETFTQADRALLAGRHTDKRLQTKLFAEQLATNLLRLYQNAVSLLEEQGVNALYLTLGMLEWQESVASEVTLKAPLLLLPVELVRQNARSLFTLKTTQDDPLLNPALVEKLRHDFRLALPSLPETFEDFEPQSYFAQLQESLAAQPGWRITNEINLGLFTFQKFVMYKDLENNDAAYANHPVIQALCLGKSVRAQPLPEHLLDAKLDEALPPETTLQVLDADSSQQRALLAVQAGKDLVIEGPPGTGKSQTITNLVTEALAAGQRILFVSEKMAALEVVYNRLAAAGLQDYCLQLHSNKANKRAVLDELGRALDSPRSPNHTHDEQLKRLGVLRAELNDYAAALHTPFGKLAATPYEAFGEFDRHLSAPIVNAEIKGLADCDRAALERTCRELTELVARINATGAPDTHPWRDSTLQNLNGAQEDELREVLRQATAWLNYLGGLSQQFADELGAACPRTLGQIEVLCELALALAHSPGVSEAVLRNERWNTTSAEARELLMRGARYSQRYAALTQQFRAELLELDFAGLLVRYRAHCGSVLRFFKPAFWADRKTLRGNFQPGYQPTTNEKLLAALSEALACREDLLFLREREPLGRELFGEHWRGVESDWVQLQRLAEWVVSVRRYIIEEALQSKGITLASQRRHEQARVQERVAELRRALDITRQTIEQIRQLAALRSESELTAAAAAQLARLAARLSELGAHPAKLRAWVDYQRSLAQCWYGLAGPLLQKFFQERLSWEQLEPAFRRLFFRRWLDLVCQEQTALAHFRALTHEQRIREFQELDLNALTLARQRTLHQLARARDRELTKPERHNELVTIQREIRKRNRNLPLRQLFARAPQALLAIKPCLMMSPLSVAQFLAPKLHEFDLVVFDEASQIVPEDAVGALVRGKQAVVVGDSKQLPPTSFFSAQITAADDWEGEDAELPITDSVESVLDEFASIGFPRLRLKWHYRSRHESLIAFSNRTFYDGELLTFPAPETGVTHGGLQFDWVGGVYEGKGLNPIEARAVADAVCAHARTTPQLSLGVGTFNLRQQILIQDELEQRRRADPALEFFFTRKGEGQFFVKNLENIQGDERDVIFISVTYGPDAAGRIRHNFGPLNGANGGRRLNVIMTRAKQQLRIFSSLRGEQIDLTRAQSDGAKLLREYLLFAERGVLENLTVNPAAEMDSPFEQAVYQTLTRHGLRLVPQVGQAGYRIDFGVLDDEVPGRFIAGIECDGAAYHSAATARDRDRLRQEVLERLGWRIHRVWSTDWYYDRPAQVERLLRLIASSRRAARQAADEEQQARLREQSEIENTSVECVEAKQETAPIPQPPVEIAQSAEELSVPLYQLTPIQLLGTLEDFQLATDTTIAEVVAHIVKCEAPLHLDEAVRRVAAHWQISRAGNRIRERILEVVRLLECRQEIWLDDSFLWRKDQEEPIVRSRALTDYDFAPETICPAEFEQAILMTLRQRGPQLVNTLITESARLLGFDRAGLKLKERLTNAIQRLVAQEKLKPSAAGLQAVE
ncbi:MAG: DUF3320 domain-containing protein [Acidobacteria bacterium]|nr:DUF3320 domain-containing protein [Acidobacteriota bacterium]MBI3423430.1 DUF3320 domain-containing protein [Acidobacteriota bacterium]